MGVVVSAALPDRHSPISHIACQCLRKRLVGISEHYSRIVSYSQARIPEEVSQIGGDGGGSAVRYLTTTVAVRLPGAV